MAGMTAKQFSKILMRDQRCYHCGQELDLVPQHRINRGAGGKNAKADSISNCIAFCALANGAVESNARLAAQAREYGWKLSQWDEPTEVPVWDVATRFWYVLDNLGNRKVLSE